MPAVGSSASPRTDALIKRVMAEHPHEHLSPRGEKAALAKYYEAVHQELAPLCRELEAENTALRDRLCNPVFKSSTRERK